jgi:hypothetical protein
MPRGRPPDHRRRRRPDPPIRPRRCCSASRPAAYRWPLRDAPPDLQLADDLPQVAELDLNPVIARPDGVVAVDARIRVTSHGAADPFLRQLPVAKRP